MTCLLRRRTCHPFRLTPVVPSLRPARIPHIGPEIGPVHDAYSSLCLTGTSLVSLNSRGALLSTGETESEGSSMTLSQGSLGVGGSKSPCPPPTSWRDEWSPQISL